MLSHLAGLGMRVPVLRCQALMEEAHSGSEILSGSEFSVAQLWHDLEESCLDIAC